MRRFEELNCPQLWKTKRFVSTSTGDITRIQTDDCIVQMWMSDGAGTPIWVSISLIYWELLVDGVLEKKKFSKASNLNLKLFHSHYGVTSCRTKRMLNFSAYVCVPLYVSVYACVPLNKLLSTMFCCALSYAQISAKSEFHKWVCVENDTIEVRFPLFCSHFSFYSVILL